MTHQSNSSLSQEIAVVSLNGFIHCWDAGRMKQLMSKRLPHTMENVCLATDEDCQMYAVGSKVGTNIGLFYFIQILIQ